MAKETFTVTPDEEGLRLDQIVPKRVPGLSRRKARAVIDEGGVFVDRTRTKVAGVPVRAGQVIEVNVGGAVDRDRSAPVVAGSNGSASERAGTPAAEVQRMEKAIQQVLQMPDVKEVMSQRLMVTPLFRNSAQMDTLQREELAHWEPIIAASGFKPD